MFLTEEKLKEDTYYI